MPLNQVDAVTRIQSAWRMHRSNKANKPPVSANPTTYKTFVSSNEPDPKFPPSVNDTTNFVFIGTGGLVNLKWVQTILKKPVKSKDGYTGIPKIYIVDNSSQVQYFWQQIKHAFAVSKTFEAFKTQILISRDKFRDCGRITDYGVADQIIDYIKTLIEDDPENWYEFIKNSIDKLTFILGDWSDRAVPEYISSNTAFSASKYIYMSNILEYVVSGTFTSEQALLKATNKVETIVKNIYHLNFDYIIHARTTREKYLRVDGIQPDIHMCVPRNIPLEQHHLVLNASHLYPITYEEVIKLINSKGGGQSSTSAPVTISAPINDRWMKKGFLLAAPVAQSNKATPEQKKSAPANDSWMRKGFLLAAPVAQSNKATPEQKKSAPANDRWVKKGFLKNGL